MRVHTNRLRSKEDVGMSCKVSHGGMGRASMVLDLYGTAGGAAGSTFLSSGQLRQQWTKLSIGS